MNEITPNRNLENQHKREFTESVSPDEAEANWIERQIFGEDGDKSDTLEAPFTKSRIKSGVVGDHFPAGILGRNPRSATYLPTTKLDAGAKLELQLAKELREINPEFDKTRVDLTPFQPLRAKIDCITIMSRSGISSGEIKLMIAEMAAKLSRPNNQPKVVTLHDPSVNDLQYLQEHYPDARVTYIEIAVDAFLPDGSNDLYLLRQLKEQIRHCIAPQEHKNFTRAERKFWNIPENRRSLDAASHAAPLTTVTYEARNNGLSLKLYLKTIDQGKPVPVYCLRAEFALKTTAPAWAGLSNVADLPAFTKNLRKHCSKAFCIGRGFKESDTDGHKWKQFGASWDLQKRKGLRIRTDGVANRKFGDALNNLSRSLKRL